MSDVEQDLRDENAHPVSPGQPGCSTRTDAPEVPSPAGDGLALFAREARFVDGLIARAGWQEVALDQGDLLHLKWRSCSQVGWRHAEATGVIARAPERDVRHQRLRVEVDAVVA